MTVRIQTSDHIAIVTIDYPPVNATAQVVRQDLWDIVERTEADPEIEGVVLACAGKTFIAGADIREFGQPSKPPLLPDLLMRIEMAQKPWIAAIHGTALGGGLETALACHARIATADATLGLPEVTLGLIPGAGGTVRLPRLVAVDVALEMIASGKPVSAHRAKQIGLVDQIAQEDLLEESKALALHMAHAQRSTGLLGKSVLPESRDGDFDRTAKRHLARARGQHAPAAAVEALHNALSLPPETALERERALFLRLRDGQQSKALRHIFFAEKAAGRVERLKSVAPRPLTRIGVIGGGTMGAGIAAACLMAGFSVTLVERDGHTAAEGHKRVSAILDGALERGKLSKDEHAQKLLTFQADANYEGLSDTDLIIEAVFEDMEVKSAVFEALDRVSRSDAILASNTSYLDVGQLAARTQQPGRVIGLHFFSPAHIMKLLEIVVPKDVDDLTLSTSLAFARRLGKIPVLSGVCDGFIANRIMSRYRREGEYMLEDGALPWQIDAAMEIYGFPMGLFRMQDLAGLDISWAMRKRQAATRNPAQRYVHIGDKLCEAGHFGRKTGRGYYEYGADGRAQPCAETEALILSEAKRKGIRRRAFTDKEIMDRILFSMQDEAQQILAEGIARNSDDIDVVMVNAFGFPRWLGGPMFAADSMQGSAET